MRFLIDGYNLAHATGDIEGRVSSRGLERARMALVQRLAKALASQVAEVTLVFDAETAPRDTPAQLFIQGIDVRNTLDEEADDLIERLIKAHSAPKQLTVVSSDRRIKEAARRRGCVVLSSAEFLDQLDRPAPPMKNTIDESAKPEPTEAEETATWLRIFGEDEKRSSGPGRRRKR